MRPMAGLAAMALVLALLISIVGPATSALAAPPVGSWSDDFHNALKVKSSDGTTVTGGKLRLAEGQPVDLGDAVPGEECVYSMVVESGNVFAGTGPKGHLVEYLPDEYYQEKFQGAPHRGVINSRGQVLAGKLTSPRTSLARALTSAGGLVYGGTGSAGVDGYVFSFDPSNQGKACVILGQCAGGGPVLSMATDGTLVYAGTSSGHVFSYTPATHTLSDMGTTADGHAVNALAWHGGRLYAASENGHLFDYLAPDFNNLGDAGHGALASLFAGTTLYMGGADGWVAGWDGIGFTDVGRPSGGSSRVNAVLESGADLYAGLENGHVYSKTGAAAFADLGLPENCSGKPVRCLAELSGTLFGGTGDDGAEGHMFRINGKEDWGSPPRAGSVSSIISYPAVGPGVFVGTDTGYLYRMTCAADGSPSYTEYNVGGVSLGHIDDMCGYNGTVFIGMASGQLLRFNMMSTELFRDLNTGSASPVNAVLLKMEAYPLEHVYLGLDNGHVLEGSTVDNGESMTFSDLGTVEPGASAVKDLELFDGTVHVSLANGDVYRLESGSFTLATSTGGSPANRLVSSGDELYVGLQNGKLFSYDGTGPAAEVADCASAVTSMAAGDTGVVIGCADGHVRIYDTTLRDTGPAPGGASVVSMFRLQQRSGNVPGLAHIWCGTSDGSFFSTNDAYLADEGQVVKKQIMINCMTDVGNGMFYAGTYRDGHFLKIDAHDPDNIEVIDRGRAVDGEREIEDVLLRSDGRVFGSTYAGTNELHNPIGGRLFEYVPATDTFIDKGRVPNDTCWWVTCLEEGPGLLMYGATCPSLDPASYPGRLFSWDGDAAPTDLGVPEPGAGVRDLVVKGSPSAHIYFGTYDYSDLTDSNVYRYDPGGGCTLLGQAPYPTGGTRDGRFIEWVKEGSDGLIYGTQYNGYVFSFDPADYPGTAKELFMLDSGNNFNFPMGSGQDRTLLFGSMNTVSGGHAYNYDPALGARRDLGIPAPGPPPLQARVTCLATASSGPTGLIIGGTEGSVASLGGRLFKLDAYRKDYAASAVSTDIRPGLLDRGQPIPGQKNVTALCDIPGSVGEMVLGATESGSSDAVLFTYDRTHGLVENLGPVLGHGKVQSLCPDSGRYVYMGVAGNAVRDAAVLRFDSTDRSIIPLIDAGIPAGTKSIYGLALYGGKLYVGTGDSASSKPHMISYDIASGILTDLGECGERAGDTIRQVAVLGGNVYGALTKTVDGDANPKLEIYNTTTHLLTEDMLPVPAGHNNSIYSLAPLGGLLYLGTGDDGSLACYDPAHPGSLQPISGTWPLPVGMPVTSLCATGGAIYGCAGSTGHLFKYLPGTGFTDIGPVTFANTGSSCAAADDAGKVFFGTSADAKLVEFDPTYRFRWGVVNRTMDRPPATTGSVDIVSEAGLDIGKSGVGDGENISDINAVDNPGVRLRANLSTTDSLVTPAVTDWALSWTGLPGIDRCYPSSAYSGDYLWVSGSNFGTVEGTVTVGGASARIIGGTWSDGGVQVEVPAGATTGDVVVRTGGEDSNPGTFTLMHEPRLDSLAPPAARVGESVTLAGQYFSAARGTSTVSFDGIPVTEYSSWSDGSVSVKVPAGAASGLVTVTVNGRVSDGVDFTVVPPQPVNPVVRITSPGNGSTVTGTTTVTAEVQGECSAVHFFLDGSEQAAPTGAPYSFSFDASKLGDGGHVINAHAVNDGGGSGDDSITVYVDHTVPAASTHWYFAEGCTAYGFETFVLLANTGKAATDAKVRFMDDTGHLKEYLCRVQPGSRATINAAQILPNSSFSIDVTSDEKLVCERSMYWGGRIEGHDTIGSDALSTGWFFAEGCTAYGFQTYLLLGNPSDQSVGAVIHYQFADGTAKTMSHQLGPHSRITVNAAEEVGAKEFSSFIETSAPGIVAERSMYMLTNGARRMGTGTIGCREPSKTWFLSEGSTDWGFETWLLIERPYPGDATVSVKFCKSTGETVERVYTVKGNSRYTVDVAGAVGRADVSTEVTSDQPVVCERSMYWNSRTAGHATIGAPSPNNDWTLAEGCTDYGFETWVLLDNPWDAQTAATVTFMKQDGTSVPVSFQLGPHSRMSINAALYVPSASFATAVSADRPIMVERAMYWNNRGGGTGSIGAR
jgi:Bacterial Ig domain/IPT/TIG domain